VPRTLDSSTTQAIERAALLLLAEVGFGQMSVEAVAERAGVGKPAIYRRYANLPDLITAVVGQKLSPLEAPDLGNTRSEILLAMQTGFPMDGPEYVRLIGGLIGEENRHPELIERFRQNILLPRRKIVEELIERGIERGDIRSDISAVSALDLLAGPLLARVFAGEPTGPKWRKQAFTTWWTLVSSDRKDQQ
jgi:AcrR family transcriptional regulator